jgi:hypothetical protein
MACESHRTFLGLVRGSARLCGITLFQKMNCQAVVKSDVIRLRMLGLPIVGSGEATGGRDG